VYDFDVLVIGSGPGGQKAAIAAAKLDRRVAIVERQMRMAGADKIVIATGTKPARPASVEFDERTVIDSDGIVHLERVPRSMVVGGAGVIGIE
jgi:NAD(P) transhydrogenase